VVIRLDAPLGGHRARANHIGRYRLILATAVGNEFVARSLCVRAGPTHDPHSRDTMRLILTAASLLLTLAAACSGDYGRPTSPYDTPPGSPPNPTDTPPPAPARAVVSLAIVAPDSILVAGDSTQLEVFGLDAAGQRVAKVQFPALSVDNGFSFLLNGSGFLTALYSSFRPFRANVTASATIDGVFLTTTKRFDVRSAAPARFDFLTSMLPEDIRPEPLFSAADGIVYLTFTDAGIDFTILWSHLAGNPVGAHLHGPADTEAEGGIVADFSIGDQPDDHGIVRGTLTAASIRGLDGRPPISLDSLKTLIRERAVYADVHSVGFPAGEIRGSPFAVPQ
jgi:hypothetical protein